MFCASNSEITVFAVSIVTLKIVMHLLHLPLSLAQVYRQTPDQKEWQRRGLSMVFCLMLPYFIGQLDWDDFATKPMDDIRIDNVRFLWAITLGYCSFDVLELMQSSSVGYEMVLHHVVMFAAVYSQVCVPFRIDAAIILLLSEMSTPFLNFRWMLLQYRKTVEKESSTYQILYSANGVLLWLSFFLIRILPNFWFLYEWIHESRFTWYGRILYAIIAIFFAALNFYWFYLISVRIFFFFLKSSETPHLDKKQKKERGRNKSDSSVFVKKST